MMRLLHTPLENFEGTWRDRGVTVDRDDDDVAFMIFDGDISYSRDFRYEREERPDGSAIHRWRRVADGDISFTLADGFIIAGGDLRYDREDLPDGRSIRRWRQVKP